MLMGRYISVKMNDSEIYVEDIPATGSIKNSVKACFKRLNTIRKALPKAKWSITIEQQWKDNGDSHFQILDVETGELQEQVL